MRSPVLVTTPVINRHSWQIVDVEIQNVAVGQRVPANNPELTDQQRSDLYFEIEPADWRKISLEQTKPDGTLLEVVLLRHQLWLDAQELKENDQADLDMPELGAVGLATITKIEACPEIPDGPGQVITGTFKHTAQQILYLDIEGSNEPLGVTPEHPFWSEDRQAFVPAGELRIGENLISIDGTKHRLTSITPRAGPQTVHNFEVAIDHVYYVGESGLLVHNLYLVQLTNQKQLVIKGAGGKFVKFSDVGLDALRKSPSKLKRTALSKTLKQEIADASGMLGKHFNSSTGKLSKKYHFGHVAGWEHRRLVKAADTLGLSQKQLNQYVRHKAKDIIRIQDAKKNLSHADELKGVDQLDEILDDMKKFFDL